MSWSQAESRSENISSKLATLHPKQQEIALYASGSQISSLASERELCGGKQGADAVPASRRQQGDFSTPPVHA